jgi:hypothetical protein
MRLTRPSRFVATFLALVSMLFMQVAVAAAYACPSPQEMESQAPRMTSADYQFMADCEEMAGSDQLMACHAHSKVSNPSFERPASSDFSPSAVMLLVTVITDVDTASLSDASHSGADWRRHTSGTPLSIQNCCFRI